MKRLIDAERLKAGFFNACIDEHFKPTKLLNWDNITNIINNAPTVENRPIGEWVPVKYRPMTTEERKDFAEFYGIEYSDTVDEKMFDCPLPDDGQEILISTKWGVCTDCADNDNWDGFTTYGLEGKGDWDGVDAWQPLPEPYKKGGGEE